MRWFNNQYNGFPSTKFRGYLDHLTVYAVGQEVNAASTAPHSRRGAANWLGLTSRHFASRQIGFNKSAIHTILLKKK